MRCSSSDSQTTKTVSLNDPPIAHDLAFVRGDHVNRNFLFTGIVYTPERPTDDADVPIPDEELPAPWEERYWFSEIRSSYGYAIRFYNGWVPWYGSAPRNWTWWNSASLKGFFDCTATYDAENLGTVVSITLPSDYSCRIMPSHGEVYHWDLESARPSVKDEDGTPTFYDHMKTWMSGGVDIAIDWTLNTPQQPVYT